MKEMNRYSMKSYIVWKNVLNKCFSIPFTLLIINVSEINKYSDQEELLEAAIVALATATRS